MLAKVMLPNDYFKVGDFVEITGDEVQKVRISVRDGRIVPGRFEGLVFPLSKVRKYLMILLKRGFDDQGAYKESRTIVLH